MADTPTGRRAKRADLTAEAARQLLERIEKTELIARDIEAQARIYEARKRLNDARTAVRKHTKESPDDDK